MAIIQEKPDWFNAALSVEHKSAFVEIKGAKVHYLEWGSNKNPSVITVSYTHLRAHET